ncbi:uncharacterized protein LOC6568322 [Drosophila grimshawi]|uniref:GH14824 n=1 Tax=Drosophila grimshawi TaxID=7222 RepID=B4JUY0_DROGR|nr:uncharacterized protein LOC6568322 [Drosophila grimshawi]EDV91300.1 GH14824 [Drosophila grimshawi]
MPEKTVQEFIAAPSWLTREYVQQKLRAYLKDAKLELKKLQIKPATAGGENYASVMTRITVEYIDKNLCQETTTFIVKTTFADKDPAAEFLEQYGIYTREMDMYEEVLPKLAIILQQDLDDHRKMFAGTVCVDRERDSIMFEDMSLESYTTADRIKQLDLQHTQLVLEKLAKFHAAGALLNEKNPGIFDKKYDRCFFNSHTRAYEPLMKNMLRSLIASIEDDKLLHQRYASKLNGLIEHIMEYSERAMEVNKEDFVTLCHGDLWTTNTMFNYDEQGKPNNVILIDFQFSVYSSPAIDLHYFFSTSLQDDLYQYHQMELIQFYYQKLVESLTKLGFSGHVPSLFQFQQQFQARAFYEIFSSFIFLPAMICTGSEGFNIEKGISQSDNDIAVRSKIYKNPMVQKKLRRFLPFFDQRGLLDEL